MNNETWNKLESSSAEIKMSQPQTDISSTENTVLAKMKTHFGNKVFLRHHAQGFDQFPLTNAYRNEEESFLKTVKQVVKQYVPEKANIISSHTIYKV